MNFAEVTVTVYFVGLVTFYTPPALPPPTPPNPVRREVIVPMTPAGQMHGAVALMPHEASLSIQGLHQGKTDCDTLKGTWDGTTCIVDGLAGKTISLPASTTAFATGTKYARVPRMRGQCPNVTLDPAYLTDESKYAARLSLTHGSLNICTHRGALVPYLTLQEASGNLTLSSSTSPTASVELDDKAVVIIVNSPATPPADEREHFWWYYKMYVPPAGRTCTGFPKVQWSDSPCQAVIPHPFETETGGGCTPSEFP